MGAYHLLFTPFIPATTAVIAGGCYAIPALRTDIVGVFTNTFSTDAIRGAGRPEGAHLIEVMIDQVAAELGLDPLEVRRRNFIPKEDFPRRARTGPSTTRATTRPRSTARWSTSTSRLSAASRPR